MHYSVDPSPALLSVMKIQRLSQSASLRNELKHPKSPLRTTWNTQPNIGHD